MFKDHWLESQWKQFDKYMRPLHSYTSLNKNTKIKHIIPAVKMQCHTQQELIKGLCAAGVHNSHNNDLQWAFHSSAAALCTVISSGTALRLSAGPEEKDYKALRSRA